jgi:drug/metabolite transporter (DMT)-like permease
MPLPGCRDWMMSQVEKSEIDKELEPAGEARWPAAGAVLAAIVLTVLLPDGERVGPGWLLPAIDGVLLVAIVAGDPGRINRRSRLLRGLSIALVAVLVLGALSSTLLLIDALTHGGPETNSADALLSAGTTVNIFT